MTDIPEEVTTIRLGKLQRAALASFLKTAPPDYTFQDLLDLVVIKGLCVLLAGRELPDITEPLNEIAEAGVPQGDRSGSRRPRIASDFVGFSILPEQQSALAELEERYPLVDDEEMGRILLDCALSALPNDDVAQRRLGASFTSWFAQEAGKP